MIDQNNIFYVENANGEIEKVNIFAEIHSKRDDKVYVLLTTDKEIGDVINISFGIISSIDGKLHLEIITDEEEINYIKLLINGRLEEIKNGFK